MQQVSGACPYCHSLSSHIYRYLSSSSIRLRAQIGHGRHNSQTSTYSITFHSAHNTIRSRKTYRPCTSIKTYRSQFDQSSCEQKSITEDIINRSRASVNITFRSGSSIKLTTPLDHGRPTHTGIAHVHPSVRPYLSVCLSRGSIKLRTLYDSRRREG